MSHLNKSLSVHISPKHGVSLYNSTRNSRYLAHARHVDIRVREQEQVNSDACVDTLTRHFLEYRVSRNQQRRFLPRAGLQIDVVNMRCNHLLV